MECEDCKHVFTDGYWTGKELKEVYGEDKPDQTLGGNMDHQREFSARIVHKMQEKFPTGVWCDAGFGNGSLVFTAAELGFDAYGIETRPNAVKGMQEIGYRVYEGNVLDWDYSDADIVSLGDVLEHLPYPKAFLHKLHTDGVKGVYVSCPNMDSATWKALDKFSTNPYWAEFEHHHNFTRKRLSDLLEETGFTPFFQDLSAQRYICNMEIYACR